MSKRTSATITINPIGVKEALIRCVRVWETCERNVPCDPRDIGYIRGCLETIVDQLPTSEEDPGDK